MGFADFAGRALHALAAVPGALPLAWQRALGRGFGRVVRWLDLREARIARRNLELLGVPEAGREGLVSAILEATGANLMETLRVWTHGRADNLALVRAVRGRELLEAALAQGRGAIVAAPHYGNWELLNQWLASHTPLAILYAPPESAIGDAFLRQVRADDANAARVTQVRAEGPGVRQLFKLLKDGGVVGILPDQQPKRGDGEFAPFFGVPALTMTLLGRLAHRTGAAVVFAYCERIDDGHDGKPGFALHIDAAPEAVGDADPAVAVTALNAALERIARRDPSQYQWTYKRYTLQPPGSEPDNPYLGIR